MCVCLCARACVHVGDRVGACVRACACACACVCARAYCFYMYVYICILTCRCNQGGLACQIK